MRYKLNRDEENKILDWLSPINYAAQQRNFIRLRQEGTGQWLLESTEFQTWLKTDNQTLFCPGIPGAGKTFITSIVIDYLETNYKGSGIAYIYCNVGMQGEQTPEGMLKSILKQMVRKQPLLPKDVKDLFDQHIDKQSRPGLREISEALETIIPSDSRIFIILDALDECQNHDGCRDILLSEIFALQAKTRINIFATSRPQEVEAKFSKCIKREIVAIDEDIEAYLDGKISLWENLHNGNLENIGNVIKTEITRAADGMFLLAALHMNALQSQETKGEIRDALGDLAKGENKLDQAYHQTMERIQSQEESPKRLALRSLAWIFHAKRPLSTVELLHALAVRPNKSMLDESYIPDIRRILSVCAGLVRIDEKSQIIDIIHKTTRDYFKLTGKTWFPEAESDISTACITYLSFDTFQSGYCQTDSDFEERLRLHKLFDYAAKNWGHHARMDSTSHPGVIEFFQKPGQVIASTQVLKTVKVWLKDRNYSQRFPKQINGLHLAAHFGLDDVVRFYDNNNNLDPKDSHGETPLFWAASRGQSTTVELLLEKGANIEAMSNHNGTPLNNATQSGHDTVVRLLINKGANIDAKDDFGQTPLHQAAWRGHEKVVQLLINKGANIDAKDNLDETPLYWAVQGGKGILVQLLLEKGAKIDVKDIFGETLLSYAIRTRRENIVQLLRKHID